MLVSLNWLKQYVPIKCSVKELVDLIGSRLVEIEDTVDLGERYKNIYVVQVTHCEAIPGTHLHLCSIDVGSQKLNKIDGQDSHAIQVICGAPNVHAGMLAVWIAPGAIVPQSVHEDAPFVIGKRKMLGKYDSYGMLAGADELDFGSDHSGIVELAPNSATPGSTLIDVFALDDIILNIENKSLTHRPDAFGLIGFAREVAGILGQKFQDPHANIDVKAPRRSAKVAKMLQITTDTKLCPRYTAMILERHGDLQKTPYLTFEHTLLARCGMSPIDPIVDATNYFMLLNGQPLHAFDYDKFVAVGGTDNAKVIVRAAKNGEKITLLDGNTIQMTSDDIVITSNNVPVALAGAMGGENTMIDEHTQRVLLESATFNLANLRRTQMKHGIFSEAIQRFTKGQPASQTLINATDCAESLKPILRKIATVDCYPHPAKSPVIRTSRQEINTTLGTNFTTPTITRTLKNVGFDIQEKHLGLGTFEVQAPAWRTDIHLAVDIIEEVGRLNGYDNITPVLPPHNTADLNQLLSFKLYLRSLLAVAGSNELLTYSFIPKTLMEKVGQDSRRSFRITNSISPELQYIRQTIVPSLLQKTYLNLKAGYKKFVLFELNQVFSKSYAVDADNIPLPEHHLALVSAERGGGPQYYQLKLYFDHIAKAYGKEFEYVPFTPAKDKSDAYYEPKRSAKIIFRNITIGSIGELKNSVAQAMKLPEGTAVAEIKLDDIAKLEREFIPEFHFSNYPKVERDINITPTNQKTTYNDLRNAIAAILDKYHLIYTIRPLSIYQGARSKVPSTTFRLNFTHPHKTLEPAEISAIMKEVEKIS